MKDKTLSGPLATVVASSLCLAMAAGAKATELTAPADSEPPEAHSAPTASETPEDSQDAWQPTDQNTPQAGAAPEPAPADEADERRSIGEFVDDAVVTTRVKFALLRDDQLKGLDIKVETNEGVVSLSGEVASEAERDLAVEVAAGIDNVQDVRSEGLMVR